MCMPDFMFEVWLKDISDNKYVLKKKEWLKLWQTYKEYTWNIKNFNLIYDIAMRSVGWKWHFKLFKEAAAKDLSIKDIECFRTVINWSQNFADTQCDLAKWFKEYLGLDFIAKLEYLDFISFTDFLEEANKEILNKQQIKKFIDSLIPFLNHKVVTEYYDKVHKTTYGLIFLWRYLFFLF